MTQAIAGVQLFPNPASDYLKARLEEVASPLKISVFSPSGQELLRREYEADEGPFEVKIGLNKLPAGPYLLMLEQAGQRISQRFIRQ
ncbi:MAG TPA: T9SS type A sorting domain-containing protein [Saprospiraceae bacterium]|nr:T9SS type A sorting domain-containing protein [Saprospiraceae bacterium]